jgi:hypothetical protein
MIKKTLLLFLITFIVSNILITLFPLPELMHYDVWHRNLINTEKFVYETHPFPKIIIAGSSMGANLQAARISKNCYNLSMEGGSCFSAIGVLNRCKLKPKLVLVEINSIERNDDQDIASCIFQPLSFTAKRYLPALRDKNQPGLYIGQLLAMVQGKIQYEWNHFFAPIKEEKKITTPLDTKLLKQVSAENIKEFNTVNLTFLRNKIKKLKLELNTLKGQKIEIVFFEMPVGIIYKNTLKLQKIRELTFLAAKQEGYKWIPLGRENYLTNDGIHLNANAAIEYSDYIKQNLIKMRLL